METLYKKTKTNKIQTWKMELSGNKYRTISGHENGALVTSEWTICTGKNLGRSNETSPEQQAKAEVEAAYEKKLAQGGYSDNKEEAELGDKKFITPMLAKDYKDYVPSAQDYKSGIVYTQPKLDGIRCIATKDGLFSRKGKPITSCPHIVTALSGLFKKDPTLVLDGELYADKFSDNFNEIISIVRKVDPDAEQNKIAEENIQYHVYDLVCYQDKTKEKFSNRNKYLTKLLAKIKFCEIVDTYKVQHAEELDALYGTFVDAGYEGQMVRIDKPYEVDRSKYLLKRKEFIDKEFTVIQIQEGVGNRSKMAGTIVYQLDDTLPVNYPESLDNTFRSSVKGNRAYFTKLLKEKDKYVGGKGTVKYFDLTPAGVPRFPVTIALYEGSREL